MRRTTSTVLALVALVALAAAAGRAATGRDLYHALLKAPSSLPHALEGSRTGPSKLSRGSRLHHAVGAVSIGNGQALVGYLVFPTHALAVADLKAYPPNTGPNKVVTRHLAGFPRPLYVIHAEGNGFQAAYVIFVLDNVIVNSWAYGAKGSSPQLMPVVKSDARWAKAHLLQAMRR